MFSDPDTFRKISAVRSPYTKGEFYTFARLVPDEDNLFSMRDEEKRRELKAKMASAVSTPLRGFLTSSHRARFNSTRAEKWAASRRVSTNTSPG
jgi:hypothetical protein